MAFWNLFTILPRGHRILILLLSSLLGGLLLWPAEDAQALRVTGEPDIDSRPEADPQAPDSPPTDDQSLATVDSGAGDNALDGGESPALRNNFV